MYVSHIEVDEPVQPGTMHPDTRLAAGLAESWRTLANGRPEPHLRVRRFSWGADVASAVPADLPPLPCVWLHSDGGAASGVRQLGGAPSRRAVVLLTTGCHSLRYADALEADRRGARVLVHLRCAGHYPAALGVPADAEVGDGEAEIRPAHEWLSVLVLEVRVRPAMALHECAIRAPHLLRLVFSPAQRADALHQRMARAAAAAAEAPVAKPEVRPARPERPTPRLPEGVANWLVAVPMPDPPTVRPESDKLGRPPSVFADGRPPLVSTTGGPAPSRVFSRYGMRPGL